MTAPQMLLCLGVAIAMAAGQALFKLAAQAWTRADQSGLGLVGLITSPALIGALALYGVTTIAWIYVLRSVPLSRAYAFALLGSALVPLLAVGLFGETLTLRYGLGFLLILAGLYLCVGSTSP